MVSLQIMGIGGAGRRRYVHPFPARMSIGLARMLIMEEEREHAGRHGRDGCAGQMTILDPMAGAGTVLEAAKGMGHNAIGFDVDPLAALIANVGIGRGGDEVDVGGDLYICTAADRVLAAARDDVMMGRIGRWNEAACGAGDGRYGMGERGGGHDDETCKFIGYWFDAAAAGQLDALAARIRTVDDAGLRNVMWCAFSRLIIAKRAGASRAADLAHSRPHRVFKSAPRLPFDGFARSVQAVLGARRKAPTSRRVGVMTSIGDARRMAIRDCSVDMVLTSPPYINAIDYMRCSKFSLVWQGYGVGRIRDIRSAAIGTEAGLGRDDGNGDMDAILHVMVGSRGMRVLGNRRLAILSRYVRDMADVVKETGRVLKGGAAAVFVVGENTMRGTAVRVPSMVQAIAGQAGMSVSSVRYRDIPASGRYMPPPSTPPFGGENGGGPAARLNARMRREALVALRKM